MTPHFVVFGRHARLPVDWITDLGPTVKPHTLQGWVRQHHKALSSAYQAVKKQTQRRQERDQAHYNKRAKPATLLPGERVLIRNFRRRAKGKLTPRWAPEPFVIVTQLREGHPVFILRPEGKESPTRTVHRNNLRPCPLNVLQDSEETAGTLEPPVVDQPNQLPPPTWWLPALYLNPAPALATETIHPAQANPPDPLERSAASSGETEHLTVRRSQRTNFGLPPTRYLAE